MPAFNKKGTRMRLRVVPTGKDKRRTVSIKTGKFTRQLRRSKKR